MFEPMDAEARAGSGEEWSAEGALRKGLRELPVPPVSAGFDDRVLAAVPPGAGLRQGQWGWRPLWHSLRPVLGGAGCSLVLTVALYAWTVRLPVDSRPARATTASDWVSLDRALERAAHDPSALGYFTFFRRNRHPAPPPASAPSVEPPQRDDRSSRPTSVPWRQSEQPHVEVWTTRGA